MPVRSFPCEQCQRTAPSSPEDGALFRFQDQVQEGSILELGEFAQDEGGVQLAGLLLEHFHEGEAYDVPVQVYPHLVRDGVARLFFGRYVQGGEHQVFGARNGTVRLQGCLRVGAEVEDAPQPVVLRQPADILVRGVVQVGGTQQHAFPYHLMADADAAQVAGVHYILKKCHFSKKAPGVQSWRFWYWVGESNSYCEIENLEY